MKVEYKQVITACEGNYFIVGVFSKPSYITILK